MMDDLRPLLRRLVPAGAAIRAGGWVGRVPLDGDGRVSKPCAGVRRRETSRAMSVRSALRRHAAPPRTRLPRRLRRRANDTTSRRSAPWHADARSWLRARATLEPARSARIGTSGRRRTVHRPLRVDDCRHGRCAGTLDTTAQRRARATCPFASIAVGARIDADQLASRARIAPTDAAPRVARDAMAAGERSAARADAAARTARARLRPSRRRGTLARRSARPAGERRASRASGCTASRRSARAEQQRGPLAALAAVALVEAGAAKAAAISSASWISRPEAISVRGAGGAALGEPRA